MANFRYKKEDGTCVYFEHKNFGYFCIDKDNYAWRDVVEFNSAAGDRLYEMDIDIYSGENNTIENRELRFGLVKDALLKQGVEIEKCQELREIWTPFYFNGTEI